VTAPRRTPPGRRQAAPLQIPDPRTADTDLSEMREPDDLLFPDDCWPQGTPEYVVVIHQRPGWPPGRPPTLVELLRAAGTREPEPDLEAEP
jgi:hypothetical protein